MSKVHSLAGMAGTPLLSEGLLVLLGCVDPVLTKYTDMNIVTRTL